MHAPTSGLEFSAPRPAACRRRAAFSPESAAIPNSISTARTAASATSQRLQQDGGLAVLYGNIASDGCIVKTAGVDESIWKFSGRARFPRTPPSRHSWPTRSSPAMSS